MASTTNNTVLSVVLIQIIYYYLLQHSFWLRNSTHFNTRCTSYYRVGDTSDFHYYTHNTALLYYCK